MLSVLFPFILQKDSVVYDLLSKLPAMSSPIEVESIQASSIIPLGLKLAWFIYRNGWHEGRHGLHPTVSFYPTSVRLL